jgi:nicotinamide riboside kinase
MPQTTAQKLKIKENFELVTIHAPSQFAAQLEPLPHGVRISGKSKSPNQVHWFVKDRAQVEKEVKDVLDLVKGDAICWIYFPKGRSGVQTDLTRDKGWEALAEYKLQFLTLVSFDNTWSAFGMRLGGKNDAKKTFPTRGEQYAAHYDAKTKTVYLPDDMKRALAENKQLQAYFEKLAFSHKREYIEWVVSAKKDETRAKRIIGMIERLEKGWKNPAGR